MYGIYMYVPQTYISYIFMLMNISFLSGHDDKFKFVIQITWKEEKK